MSNKKIFIKPLQDWVDEVGSLRAAAKYAGVSHTSLWNWIHGTAAPSRRNMRRLMVITRNAVKPKDFLDAIDA